MSHPENCKNAQRKYLYGVSGEEFAAILAKQNNQCAICGTINPTHLDHNHVTGVPRGILCGTCNQGIGLLKDSPIVCRNAATYLEYTK